MYKTLENAIRSIQKDALDEELGEASKKRMKIKAVAREEDSRDGEVPTRQGEIQKKVVDEAEDKKKMKVGGKKTEVILNPEMDTKGTANQMKEAKDEREYGYEGEMATSQLKSIIQNAEAMLGMLQDNTDLPEWVQSKITLAQDYVMSAKDYLSTEMSEDVDDKFASMSRGTTRGGVVKTTSGYIATNLQGSTKSFKNKAEADEHASSGMKEEVEQVDEARSKEGYQTWPGQKKKPFFTNKAMSDETAKWKARKDKEKSEKEKLAKEEIEQVDEKLKGSQHKLDAHDFELLRKKKKFAESNGISDSLLDVVKSVVSKEAEEKLDETLKPTKMFDREEFNKELKSYNAKTREILKSAKKEKAASAKKEPEVNKEEVEQVDEAFVVYHKKSKNIVSKHVNHATAKKHAEKRGDDFAVASHEYWQDKIKPMKEEVNLSADELARLESIAKKFD
jgi:hypothetical protein